MLLLRGKLMNHIFFHLKCYQHYEAGILVVGGNFSFSRENKVRLGTIPGISVWKR